MTYRGRFAPSPTGPLHFGSLVSALASWLDARAHGGVWLVRIEDIDGPRTVPGAAEDILATLDQFGLHADEPPLWQSERTARYQEALEQLRGAGLVYPCGCTRKEISDSLLNAHARNTTLAYPGTCRDGLHGKPARAWRLRVPDGDTAGDTAQGATEATAKSATITFDDRWQGTQTQNLATEVGDFVLRRADDQWAYQLAVVVDDADAGITHIVRGADLLDSTERQIYLQRCLGVATPTYMHVPVVTNKVGEKLSKQTGATALDATRPLEALYAAAEHLKLEMSPTPHETLKGFYDAATTAWTKRIEKLRTTTAQ
ncbi:MAG: tRNA glutamyl-Q(34) synthetase GluQRS [Pseudomonadota bacterium]|jgi:glutamyl-Q tRNA(Asp) synthetase|uniref:tRNA glutamyl-Q(34) synthetase GluQRS n=1 Tax=Burkholderiaceae TaxID=119060 RepID=UPI0010F88E23|nr:tRNA glutamyl-Q(34) synthetase GluQRS [Burkholderia sp. 4M9327F10]